MTVHTTKWWAVVPSTRERLRRTRYMPTSAWGWDATCSCGWDSRTGGAIAARISEAVTDHLREARTAAGWSK